MRYTRFGSAGLAIVAAAGFGVLGGCDEAGYETTETDTGLGAPADTDFNTGGGYGSPGDTGIPGVTPSPQTPAPGTGTGDQPMQGQQGQPDQQGQPGQQGQPSGGAGGGM